ncbi:DUF2002 family protein [Lysobacter soli]|uniref:DUF2002 family protein n=1 Tax=Lysobacter soli TaxID=453783 RepID=UPI00240EE9DA|nr:DUF2002 family protein [Lysobacter soli]MDG2518096.1 DUF2002 family protein [Lysobacter soli]
MTADLSHGEVVRVLQERGFQNADVRLRKYAQSWQRVGELVNVKNLDSNPLVIHPRHGGRLAELQTLPGVRIGERPWCHNSQFAGFPKRIHTGRYEVHYGIDFGFASADALHAFLDVLLSDEATIGRTRFDAEALRFLHAFLSPDNPQLDYWLPRYRDTLAAVREALAEGAPELLFERVWKSRDNAVSNAGRGRMGHDEADRNRDRLSRLLEDIAADGSPARYALAIEHFQEWCDRGYFSNVYRLLVARAFAAIHPERYHTTVDAEKQERIIPWFVEHTGFAPPAGSWAVRAEALSAHLDRSGLFPGLELRNMFPWFVFEQMKDATGKVPFRPGHTPKPARGAARGSSEMREIDYRHNRIQDRLFELLCARHGKDAVGTEQPTGTGGRADALVRLSADRCELYEIKPAMTAADAVRQAMGQLLEYAYRRGGLQPMSLYVVSDAPLDDITAEFLSRLRSEFAMPIEYMQVTVEPDAACAEASLEVAGELA